MIYEYRESQWTDTESEKPKNSEKNLSQYHLSAINTTLADPDANPGLRGERPATNRLSHGTVQHIVRIDLIVKLYARVGYEICVASFSAKTSNRSRFSVSRERNPNLVTPSVTKPQLKFIDHDENEKLIVFQRVLYESL
jgi:hypothetical protein